jgi:hypothetical protein
MKPNTSVPLALSDTSSGNCPHAMKILDQGLGLMPNGIKKKNRFLNNERALLAAGKPGYLDLMRNGAMAVINTSTT